MEIRTKKKTCINIDKKELILLIKKYCIKTGWQYVNEDIMGPLSCIYFYDPTGVRIDVQSIEIEYESKMDVEMDY